MLTFRGTQIIAHVPKMSNILSEIQNITITKQIFQKTFCDIPKFKINNPKIL